MMNIIRNHKINDNSFMCFNARGTASFELGNFDEAIEDFKKAYF